MSTAYARDTATIHINREKGFTPGENHKPAPCREDGPAQGVLCCALNREGVSASLMLPGLGCLAECISGGEGLEFGLYVVAGPNATQ